MNFDLSLYLVTDRSLLNGKDFLRTVQDAVEGGVTMVQLREKNADSLGFYCLAVDLKKLLSKYDVPLIINDRLDIALAVDADGLHLGQSDLPCAVARKILGKDKIIGLSIESVEQSLHLASEPIDYIAYSPVFATNTKEDISSPLGLGGVNKISASANLPGVAIGGINEANADKVIGAGADGIAVVSAIMQADNPKLTAKSLRGIVEKAKSERK